MPPPPPPSTDHTVNITANPSSITYSHPHKTVIPYDRLRWYANVDVAILFEGNKSPFKPKLLAIGVPANTYTNFYVIKKPTQKKKYYFKYTVAAHVGGPNPIIIDDPEIIIDNDSGSGGGKSKSKRTAKKTAKRPAKK